LVFIISGFWHGASWTFILWGLFHGIVYLITHSFIDIHAEKDTNETTYNLKYILSVLGTFSIVSFAWIFFRAESIDSAFLYINNLFTWSIFSIPNFMNIKSLSIILFFIVLLLIIEWKGKNEHYAIRRILNKKHKIIRWSFYSLLIFLIGMYSNTDSTPFIYFQF